MEAYLWLGIYWLVLWNPFGVTGRTNTKSGLAEETVQVTPKPPAATELPTVADRCRGYYDVMGQWDPPFNCNASSYLYCCGTCGYRFCCQFKHGRLDQSLCSNYDTPNWANTGKPPAREDSTDDPSKDKTNMIVYIICGVAALMVLIGIFTKLAVEKTQRPPTDMNVSRTLTDLLKQPAQVDLVNDGHRGSIQVQITEVIPRMSPRNSIETAYEAFACKLCPPETLPDGGVQRSEGSRPFRRSSTVPTRADSDAGVEDDHTNFNNMGLTSPLVPLTQNHRSQLVPGIPLQDKEFSKYATVKTSETAPEEYFKRFPVMDVVAASTCYQPGSLISQDSSPLQDNSPIKPSKSNHKVKISKTNTHPLAGASFPGWDPNHHEIRRQVYANKRQFSIEKLPELFSPQGHYSSTPQRHYPSNSKTEVTV